MKKRLILVCFIISLLAINVDAWSENHSSGEQILGEHDVLLEAVSWKAFSVRCHTGNILSGEFKLTSDGDLFIGDQTKYDNWLLGGINLLIFDQSGYNSWSIDKNATPLFEAKGVVELSWSIEIPTDGIWYVVYFNDSIYMKRIAGSIHIDPSDVVPIAIITLGLIGIIAILSLSFICLRKK